MSFHSRADERKTRMYCSSCGTKNPSGRHACEACGALLNRQGSRLPAHAGRWAEPARSGPVCPRCGYEGPGVTYFSRGGHVAALVGATVLTAGMMGAGGILYYLVRRDHRICPRCAHGWGRLGELALVGPAEERAITAKAPGERERRRRRASVAAFVGAALLAVAGMATGEIGFALLALLAAGGGLALWTSANNARDARRAELVTALQTPVLKLAAERGGRLTVTQVAAALEWPLPRAEKVLNSLDDGLRVDSEVTDEGVIVYEFRELLGPPDGGGAPPPLSG